MSGYGEGPWTIEYDNDVGPRDDFFVEWFDVGPARLMFDTRMGEREEAHRIARLIAASPLLLAALQDMLAGWHYIREHHGDLYGVGWDRCEQAAVAAIAAAEGETS